jgi:hypothetical protein
MITINFGFDLTSHNELRVGGRKHERRCVSNRLRRKEDHCAIDKRERKGVEKGAKRVDSQRGEKQWICIELQTRFMALGRKRKWQMKEMDG